MLPNPPPIAVNASSGSRVPGASIAKIDAGSTRRPAR